MLEGTEHVSAHREFCYTETCQSILKVNLGSRNSVSVLMTQTTKSGVMSLMRIVFKVVVLVNGT